MHKRFKLVRNTDPLDEKKLFVVIFGQPGVGKTSVSFSMPRPLHLDFDLGIDRAVQKIRPDFFSMTDYGDFHNYIMSDDFALTIEEEGYESIIIDTVGTLLDDYIAPYLMKQDPKLGSSIGLTLAGWGALSTTFNSLKARFLSLGLSICAVAHAREEGDGNNKQNRLSVKGGSADVIYRSCDMLGYMYMKGPDRVVDFNPTSEHVGKNVAALPITRIPDASTPAYDVFLSEEVVGRCITQMRTKSKAQIEFNELLEDWINSLDGCKSPASFDKFIKSIAELSDKTDKVLKVALKNLLRPALAAKGLVYNPESLKVEKAPKVGEDVSKTEKSEI